MCFGTAAFDTDTVQHAILYQKKGHLYPGSEVSYQEEGHLILYLVIQLFCVHGKKI